MRQRLSSCLRSIAYQWSLLLRRGTWGGRGGSKAISTKAAGTSLRLLRICVHFYKLLLKKKSCYISLFSCYVHCSILGSPLPFTISEFAQIHVHWVGDAIQLSHPLLPTFSSCPQSFPGVFSNESALCIRWPKYWSFSFSISPSNEYSGLISFRIGWFDLLAVWGTLKSSPASLKESILWRLGFSTV